MTKCGAEHLSVAASVSNQIHTISGPDYLYDAAGNMTHDATTGNNYSFDQENRITGAAGYTYTYDADGNRVEKSNGSNGTIYWYMSPGIVAESDLTGTLKSEYVFFDGERVARKDFPANSVFYYFSDHLKTASVITDSAGTIKEDEDFYPWGGELQFVNSDANHYKFTGKERDSETQLDYFGARYYGNWLGRFITPDWAANPVPVPYAGFNDPQSLNQYSYVRNIPTSKADPDGHCPNGPCPVFEETGVIVPEEAAGTGVTGNLTQINDVPPPPPPPAPTPPSPQEVQGAPPNVNLLGPHYQTVDQAAKAAVNAINPTSIQQNKEYAGRVVQNADGSYSTTGPNPGTVASSNPGTIPAGTTNTARYHTHGGDDPHYDSEHFSHQDKQNAKDEHVPSYVGTPSGAVKKFDPATNHVTTVQPPAHQHHQQHQQHQ